MDYGSVIGLPIGGLVVLIVVVLIVRRPVVGFYVMAVCAAVVEEESPINIGGGILSLEGLPMIPIQYVYHHLLGTVILSGAPVGIIPVINVLYVYYWAPGFEGQIERPIGYLIIFIFLVFICREKALQGGKLLKPFLFFLFCVAYGVVNGLATDGDFKIIVLEIRPFWYLFAAYLLAYNLVKHKNHIRFFFWLVIVCAGLRTIQGLYIWLIVLHGSLTQHDIMPHEDSFFFVGLILLIILFIIHHRYRPQLYTALLILPFLVDVLNANNRRADYVALLVGIVVAWILVIQIKPHARKMLITALLVCAILGSIYIAVFSHTTGSPAYAIVSTVTNQNDPSDPSYSSNLYREVENYDLYYTAKQSLLIGFGFGKAFLQPVPLPANLGVVDPGQGGKPTNFIPHNTIYWIWMRLGPIGYFALWYLFGAIIIRGCLIARQLRDHYCNWWPSTL